MKIKLTKDPSHKGYYVDENGNLYVFRFGGRPIKVDGYRDDKPRENIEAKSINVDKKDVIDHTKNASSIDNKKFIDELDRAIRNKEHQKENIGGRSYEEYLNAQFGGPVDRMDLSEEDDDSFYKNYQDELSSNREKTKSLQKDIDNLTEEKISTSARTNFDSKNEQSIRNTTDKDLRNNLDDKARDAIKKQTGQREMYQSIAKLMNDNEDKLSSEEWKALDKARIILKQNPELIADDSVLSDTSKPIHERLSKYMNDNEYKLDSGVWGPLYEANQELRKHDTAEITKLKDRYQKTQGVSDDWFVEEGRKLGMKDEDIADAIYIKKGAEAQGSTDDNIKRIIANTEKQHYERLIKEYKDAINDPKTGEWDREFMKSELPGLENKAEMFANYEAEFIKRINRDDEVFTVKYKDDDSVENFKAIGLDEAFALQEQFKKYTDDVTIYDADGKEIQYDKDRKHYSTPTYEENKKKLLKNTYRNNLYGADRSTLVSMVYNLGLNWNVERFTTQQLYRMLEKELNKK